MKKSHKAAGLVGLAAAAAAAAGAFYFYGKDGAKHRRQLKSWMVKARGEVMENIEKLADVTQSGYDKAVEDVVKKYKKLKHITPAEINTLKKEFKGHWKSIKSEVDKAAAKAGKGLKKITK
jgi:hypothetical protein